MGNYVYCLANLAGCRSLIPFSQKHLAIDAVVATTKAFW